MQLRPFLMTLIFSASRVCQSRNLNFHRAFFRPALKNASRPNQNHHHHALSSISAFQSHPRYSSIRATSTLTSNAPAESSTKTTLHAVSSDLICKWADPEQISPTEDYTLCFAGRSFANNDNVGSGMVLYDSENNEIWWGHQNLRFGDDDDADTKYTSNEAEYFALLTGLKCAKTLGVARIAAQGCNNLVHKQMEGKLKVKKPSLKELYDKVTSLSKEFDSFRVRHVEASSNERAVELAKTSMTTDGMSSERTSTAATTPLSPDEGGDTTDNAGNDSHRKTPSASPTPDAASYDPNSVSPEKTYVLRFDGGSRGNPGLAGAGMVLYDAEDGSELWSGYRYLGMRKTNNEAEYGGLVTGLQCALSLGVERIVVQGDSQLILRQIDGVYKVKSPLLKGYYDEAMVARRKFESFETNHILRARNSRADELANKAMDNKSSKGFHTS